MNKKHKNLIDKFQEFASNEDLEGLNQIIDQNKELFESKADPKNPSNSMIQNDNAVLKEAAIQAYREIYFLWLGFLEMDKWSLESRIPITKYLFEILERISKINPELVLSEDKGRCYGLLFDYTSPEESQKRLDYLNLSIDHYLEQMTKTGENLHSDIVNLRLKKMRFLQSFSENEMLEILKIFEDSLNDFNPEKPSSAIFQVFDLLELPEPFASKYFEIFLHKMEVAFSQASTRAPHFRLFWNRRFFDALEWQSNLLDKKKYGELITRAAVILEPLVGSDVDDPTQWESRGNRFLKTAEKLNDSDPRKQIFFEESIKYYQLKKGPPDLVVNPLLGLAKFLIRNGNKDQALPLLVEAELAFDNYQFKEINPFGFHKNFADFLVEYCKSFYGFKEVKLLDKAKEKYLHAIEHGKNNYLVPFTGLALVELKLGKIEESISILKKAKSIFPNSRILPLKDEGEDDFKEIRTLIEKEFNENAAAE